MAFDSQLHRLIGQYYEAASSKDPLAAVEQQKFQSQLVEHLVSKGQQKLLAAQYAWTLLEVFRL